MLTELLPATADELREDAEYYEDAGLEPEALRRVLGRRRASEALRQEAATSLKRRSAGAGLTREDFEWLADRGIDRSKARRVLAKQGRR